MRPNRVILLVAIVVGACSGSHETHHDRTTPVAVAAMPDSAGVNVPSLLNLSIDQVNQRIGPRLPLPHNFVDPAMAPQVVGHALLDSSALFRWQGLSMVAAYDHRTRQISDLLLLGIDEDALMRRAQLKLGAKNYLVLPVFQEGNSTRLMGLRVLTTGSR